MNEAQSGAPASRPIGTADRSLLLNVRPAFVQILASPAHLLLAILGAFAALYALVSLWMPLGWDHGMLASVGANLARGDMPYRDSWELKSPLAFAPYAVAYLLFGNVMWGVRVIDLAILAPLLFFFMRAVRRETDCVIGTGATLGLYLLFASQTWFFTGQPDPWAAMLVAVATCLTLAKAGQTRPDASKYLLAGLLIGSAGLIKLVYLAFGLAPLISAAFAPAGEAGRKALVRDTVLLAGGAALALLACVLYLTLGNALPDAIEAQIRYNIGTYATTDLASPSAAMKSIGGFFSRGAVALLMLLCALALWALRSDKLLIAQLLAWFFAGFAAVIAQGKYFDSHWAGVFPVLVFCAGLGIHALISPPSTAPTARVLALLACALFGLYVSVEPAREIRNWGQYVLGASHVDYYGKFRRWQYAASYQWQAAEHIRQNSGPQDGLFVWGNDATIHFLADRPNPSRFNFNLPLVVEGPYRAPYQAEAMAQLSRAPPKYMVIGISWDGADKEASLAKFPALRDFLDERYALEVQFGSVHLYRRKDTAG